MSPRIEPLTGAALADGLPALARLRIAVFRDWPYLYDGTLDYEQAYLARFAAAPRALIVAAVSGEDIVGCATAAPIDEVETPFAPDGNGGNDLSNALYCGESVLLPAHRGQGIGHAFFDEREAHGRRLGLACSVFCAVVRPDDHPLRPANYVPLDAFWTRRGYRRIDGLVGSFAWKDIDQASETTKPMEYWMKDLA